MPNRALPLLAVLTLTLVAGSAQAGVQFSFSVSGDTLSSFLDGVDADLSCDPELSPAARGAWEEVVREGVDGAASFRDDDGKMVRFRRERQSFRITTRDEEDKDIRVEIPWSFARCVIGGETPSAGDSPIHGEGLSFRLALDEHSVELVVTGESHGATSR